MSDGKWHLDKRVPVALIITIFLQTATAVWWAATTTAQQNALAEKLQNLSTGVATLRVENSEQDDDLAQIRERSSILVERLNSTIDSVNRLQGEVEETNNLLREVLRGQ